MLFPRTGHRRGGRRLAALAARWRVAAALLVVALAALSATPAQAQNANVVLVRNINQADSTSYSGDLLNYTHAQTFTTGDNAGGYTLSSIEVDFKTSPTPSGLDFSLWSVDSDGEPSVELVDLTGPASPSGGVNAFTAPSGTKLAKETSYAVYMSGNEGKPKYTTSNNEGHAKSGWSIRDNSWDKSGFSWNSEQYALQIRVKGSIDADNSVATLSALSLTDASSNSIALSPGFVADTTNHRVHGVRGQQRRRGDAGSDCERRWGHGGHHRRHRHYDAGRGDPGPRGGRQHAHGDGHGGRQQHHGHLHH